MFLGKARLLPAAKQWQSPRMPFEVWQMQAVKWATRSGKASAHSAQPCFNTHQTLTQRVKVVSSLFSAAQVFKGSCFCGGHHHQVYFHSQQLYSAVGQIAVGTYAFPPQTALLRPKTHATLNINLPPTRLPSSFSRTDRYLQLAVHFATRVHAAANCTETNQTLSAQYLASEWPLFFH